jgi:hypothetical protein
MRPDEIRQWADPEHDSTPYSTDRELEHVLRPSASLTFSTEASASRLEPQPTISTIPDTAAGLLNPNQTSKKTSPTPSVKRGKAERLLKEHGSPPGLRVTAGGRIVPASFTPLASPFNQGGPKATNLAEVQPGFQNSNRVDPAIMQSSELSNQNAQSELNPLYNIPSASSGIPVFNPHPLQSYPNIWPGFGFSGPWAGQFPGQFATPYGYVFPFAQAMQPSMVGPNYRAAYPSLNGYDASSESSTVTGVAIDQQIQTVENEHTRLNREKLEFERDEIRRSSTLSAADKAKSTEQKKQYVLRLDQLRKSIKELRKLKEHGFTHCDPVTFFGVPSPKRIKLTASQFNGDGTVSSGVPTDASLVGTTMVASSEVPNPAMVSPGRRRSHAVQIKPPLEPNQVNKPKLGLNPASPSYEPGKLAPEKTENMPAAPSTPSPSSTEAISCTNTVQNMSKNSSEQHTNTSASESSIGTVDFFPTNTAEHSASNPPHHPAGAMAGQVAAEMTAQPAPSSNVSAIKITITYMV